MQDEKWHIEWIIKALLSLFVPHATDIPILV